MAEWVKDPTTFVELWHRITGLQERDILEMASGNLIPEQARPSAGPRFRSIWRIRNVGRPS